MRIASLGSNTLPPIRSVVRIKFKVMNGLIKVPLIVKAASKKECKGSAALKKACSSHLGRI
ncbi:hypothetical protein NECAME_13048 [Necator americanus]|uniref:Uncharacterized protein n=1 Tax=Necator americanus TaxID=51031 RepID=W2SXS1_NECAM|nr:hypothetical protein NECAME_13048 [Necator americanus]ETN74323.1 hypothetical protein NECAME_13048 [Necator americanus]